MKIFDSPGKFAAYFTRTLEKEVAFIDLSLKKIGKIVTKKAKSEFGEYQPTTGPFSQWPQLADATQRERIELGYTPNDPLLRSGDLRDSISYVVDLKDLSVYIGSTSDIMPDHEFGTVRIPARPVLGPALFTEKKKIKEVIAAGFVTGLTGSLVPEHLKDEND